MHHLITFRKQEQLLSSSYEPQLRGGERELFKWIFRRMSIITVFMKAFAWKIVVATTRHSFNKPFYLPFLIVIILLRNFVPRCSVVAYNLYIVIEHRVQVHKFVYIYLILQSFKFAPNYKIWINSFSN